jgi:hypothetical protein
MRRQFLVTGALLFLLIVQRNECQSPLKIQRDEHANPAQDAWVLNDVDLDGQGNFGRIRLVKALPQTIPLDKYPKEFWEDDCYRITVEDFRAPLIYSEEFCTSYGKFTIYVTNLTGGPHPDLIFELYRNRGTDVTEKFFVVKHWDGSKLVTEATIQAGMWMSHTAGGPLANYAAVPAYCAKELKLQKVSGNQYEATFSLDSDCMAIRQYLLPRSTKEKEFIGKVTQRLVHDSKTGSYNLVNVDPAGLASGNGK